MKSLFRFGLVRIVTASTALILTLALVTVSAAVYFIVSQRISSEAVARQDSSLRAAATIVSRDIPGTQVTWAEDGNVRRIVMESIPESFESHEMIDTVGRMTGETATVFAWDEASRDFWRRTTNIIKPDGSRAVGTQLGQGGVVYPVVTGGKAYRGEAVILGIPYFTIYQPIFSPGGDIIGILYAGVKKSVITALASEMTGGAGDCVAYRSRRRHCRHGADRPRRHEADSAPHDDRPVPGRGRCLRRGSLSGCPQ